MNDTQVKTKITREEAERLRKLAAQHDLSITRMLRKILRDYLTTQEAS